MQIQKFLDLNKQINKAALSALLNVSKGTVTKMVKDGVTVVQGLALDALHAQQAEANVIDLDVTEWHDGFNTYFSAYVTHGGIVYYIPFEYGYGTHSEHLAIEKLYNAGAIPTGSYGDLYRCYNTRITRTTTLVKMRKDMHDGSRV